MIYQMLKPQRNMSSLIKPELGCILLQLLGHLSACLQCLALSQLSNHAGGEMLLGAGYPSRTVPSNKLLAHRCICIHLDMRIGAIFCCTQALKAHTKTPDKAWAC